MLAWLDGQGCDARETAGLRSTVSVATTCRCAGRWVRHRKWLRHDLNFVGFCHPADMGEARGAKKASGSG